MTGDRLTAILELMSFWCQVPVHACNLQFVYVDAMLGAFDPEFQVQSEPKKEFKK